jgi:hypothetical protein
MTYELITKHDSRNYTPNASVPAVYGRPRTIDSITIHWWGLPEWKATFEGTTQFLCTNTKPTSAHEVIEAGRVAVIVNHNDAAWAAGNPTGNATSIHLELNPRANDADYTTAAQRIHDIRTLHGKHLPLIPHRHWQATMCPGNWDLARLNQLAGTTITPHSNPPEDDDMAYTEADLDRIIQKAIKTALKEGPAGRDLAWYTWREHPIPGFNGDVSAAARLAGIDQAVNELRTLLTKDTP